MKRILALPLVLALALFASCQKQQTEAERNAEVERQVQERLAAEHQAEQQKQLDDRAAELAQREKTLSQKETASATVEREPNQPALTSGEETLRDEDEGDGSTADYSTFYDRLEPEGEWRETSTYGYVWQPRLAAQSRSWRPYTNGHWVYTDAGWTWVSNEPFGWATYHYGRWTRLRGIGWVWVPGRQWAPAWVSWRKSNDYVGWAALPPEARFERSSGIHNWADNYYDIGPDLYCFVATNELGSSQVDRVVVPPERNITIINQTVNVTNITYNNKTIVNQGPNYEELRTRTQQPIPRLRLEREASLQTGAEMRPVVRGEVLQVPAPVLAGRGHGGRPRRVKTGIDQAVVERGWENVSDRQEAEKVRAKMKSEAAPPSNAPSKTFVKPVEAGPATGASPAASASLPPRLVTPTPVARMTPGPTAPTVATPTPFRRRTEPLTTPLATPTSRLERPEMTRTPIPMRTVNPLPNVAAPIPTGTPLVAPGVPPDVRERAEQQKRLRDAVREQQMQRRRPSVPASATPLPDSGTSAVPAGTDPGAAMREQRDQRRAQIEAERERIMNERRNQVPVGTSAAASSPGATRTPALNERLNKELETRQERDRKREKAKQEETTATPTPSAPQ